MDLKGLVADDLAPINKSNLTYTDCAKLANQISAEFKAEGAELYQC